MNDIFLLFPLYDGGTYDYSYLIEEVTAHASFEAAKQYVVDAHKIQADAELDETEGEGYPPIAPERWVKQYGNVWTVELSDYDGYPDDLWGFQIVIPTVIGQASEASE